MCIGIPGQIVRIVDVQNRIGRAEVMGVTRTVNLGLLTPEEAQIGNWVMINAGLAVRAMDAEEAASALQFIEELEQQFTEEET